jgi:hypothetical protein
MGQSRVNRSTAYQPHVLILGAGIISASISKGRGHGEPRRDVHNAAAGSPSLCGQPG